MQLGMIGLGRMGANIVRRIVKDGHTAVAYDTSADAVDDLAKVDGVTGAKTLEEFVQALEKPRVAWVMIPSGITDKVVEQLSELMDDGDIIINGGNSNYREDYDRAAALKKNQNIDYLDCGTSGGVWGLDRGYCLMIGGDEKAFAHCEPLFASIAPGIGDIERTPGYEGRPDARGAGLPAVRAGRCRPLREDGPQRHRVRHDGCLRRGTERPAQSRTRATRSRRTRPKRRRSSSRSTTSTTSTWRRSPRCGAVDRSSPRGCSTSPPARCTAIRN